LIFSQLTDVSLRPPQPSSSSAQHKIAHLQRQLALALERNNSLVDEVALGFRENSNVLRLAHEIKEEAQSLSRGSRRKDAETESLKKEVAELKDRLAVQKGRVKGLDGEVKSLKDEVS